MIVSVTEENLLSAAQIQAESWQESHRSFCSDAFVKAHTPQRQKALFQEEMRGGMTLYMLVKEYPVGVVSVKEDLIENLYILPAEQNKGYGTELLLFAMAQCRGTPRLWILDNNHRALAFYGKHGFRLTGKSSPLSEQLSELEMVLAGSEPPICPALWSLDRKDLP